MIPRRVQEEIAAALETVPVVGLLGPRQVGKTTLALVLAEGLDRPWLYLDLERPSDLKKLADPELFLSAQGNRLVIIDEVQRQPELFPLLRSLVDERRRAGEKHAHYMVLGSASRDLLKQSSESLAGRIRYIELSPFDLSEVGAIPDLPGLNRLWFRGGYPLSYLAADDEESLRWRDDFIQTYVERDIPQLGLRLPAAQTRRLWSMLAHGQGNLLNVSRLAGSLGVSGATVRHYLDVLSDLYMVRQLQPWSGNTTKRLVKSPRVYVRDSGLVHALAGIADLDTLLGHPLCGESWEGFVVDSILGMLDHTWLPSFFRTSAGAEVDLVLEHRSGVRAAIEIKRTLSPKLSKGFVSACETLQASARLFVIPQGEPYPMDGNTVAIGVGELVKRLTSMPSPEAFSLLEST